jgi:hypothetical protein
MEANKILDSPINQNEGLTAYIPRYMVIKKGAIKDVSKNMALENFMQQFNSDNHNKHPIHFQIIDAVRLKMRVKETKEETESERWVWKGSRAVCLTFRPKEFPPNVCFCNMKIEVSVFVEVVWQCYKCGKFDHISTFCTKEQQAYHAKKQNMKDLLLKNLNCNCNHRENSERYLVQLKKQREIDKIMTHRNNGFLETRKIVEKWPQPWLSNAAFSSGSESLQEYVEPNMRNFHLS